MAVGVVYPFEEVDVGNGDGELPVGVVLQELFDLIQHGATVGQGGEWVGARLPVQFLVVDGQLPLTGLYAGAEKYKVDRQHQQRYDAVDDLKGEGIGAVQHADGGMFQRIGKQQHAEGYQPQEIEDLAQGRLIDVEVCHGQYGHEYVRAAG